MKTNLTLPKEKIAEFCKRQHIRRLALFGSVLRDDFTPDSDVDMLVEFEPGVRVGLIRLAGMEIGYHCLTNQFATKFLHANSDGELGRTEPGGGAP